MDWGCWALLLNNISILTTWRLSVSTIWQCEMVDLIEPSYSQKSIFINIRASRLSLITSFYRLIICIHSETGHLSKVATLPGRKPGRKTLIKLVGDTSISTATAKNAYKFKSKIEEIGKNYELMWQPKNMLRKWLNNQKIPTRSSKIGRWLFWGIPKFKHTYILKLLEWQPIQGTNLKSERNQLLLRHT